MMPINKRLKRELKKNFAKYFFIGLVLFMGITIISAFFTATDGIMSTIESQQSDCNIEDANVTLVSQLSDDNISRLHEIGINDLEDTSYCDVTALDDSDYTMRVFRVRDSVDKLSLIEGELPANDKQIVLESKTASAKDLSVGDEIDVDGKNYTLSGIVAVVDYNNVLQTVSSGVSNLKTFGLGFVSKQAFDGLDSAKMTIQYSLTAEDEQSIDDAYNYLMDEEIAVNILKQSDNPRIKSISDKTNTLKAEVTLISVVFVLLMVFIFYAMTSASVEKDSNLIGTFFSMGYTRWEIIQHYVRLPLIITLIGSVLGMITGSLLFAEPIGKITYSTYSLPTFSGKVNLYLIIMCCVIPLIIQFIINCLLLAKKLKTTPALLMRGKGKSGKGFKKVNLSKFSFPVKMYIRIMLRGIKDQLILFFGIVIAMFFLVMGFGMKDSLVEYVNDVKNESLYEYCYILNAPVQIDDEEECDKATVEGFRVEYSGINMKLTVYGLKDTSRVDGITASQNEIVISDSTASKLSLSKGDTMTVYSEKIKKDLEFKVTNIVHDPVGLSAYMDRTALNELLEYDNADNYYNALLADKELNLSEDSFAEVVSHENQEKAAEEMNTMMQPMIMMLIVVSLVIFISVMYMLLKMVVEKSTHSISLMKIFGYTNKENNHFYLNSFFITVMVSLVLSVILDKLLFTSLWPSLNANLVGFVPVKMHVYTYAVILIFGLLCYFVVTIFLKAKLKKISINTVLKQRD